MFANYFPLALMSNVRTWLMHLPENSISSWVDLCHDFIGAFTSGHHDPGRPSDLQLLQQKEGETSVRIYRDSVKFIEIFQISIRQPL